MSKIEEITARLQREQEQENRIREAQDRAMALREQEIKENARQRGEQIGSRYDRQYNDFSDLLDDKGREIYERFLSELRRIQEQRELEQYRREIEYQRQETDRARPEREINEYATQLVKIEERRDDRGNVEYVASRGDEQVTGRSVQHAAQLLDAAEQERQRYPLTETEKRQDIEARRADEDRGIAAKREREDAQRPPTPEVLAQREYEDTTIQQTRAAEDRHRAAMQGKGQQHTEPDLDRGR